MADRDAQADREAVADVMIQYANGIDDRDFDAYRDCFVEDIELTGFGPEPIRGIDTWMTFVHQALRDYSGTQHLLGPPRVVVNGDTATLRTDLQALHFYREPAGQILALWATYRTHAVRTADGWRFSRHHLDVRSTRMMKA